MSLQVWLPLNGNVNNYGLSDNITLTYSGTATFSDGGKFGKCKNGGVSIYANRNPMGYEGTICFWIYVDDNYSTSSGNLIYGNDR